jgi:hypothetical protein
MTIYETGDGVKIADDLAKKFAKKFVVPPSGGRFGR